MFSLKVAALGLLTLVAATPADQLFKRTYEGPGPASAQCAFPQVSGYTYIGCYSDNNRDRAIPGIYFASGSDNSPSWCASNCAAAGYKYFGVEYGSECFCGAALLQNDSRGNARPDYECNYPCPGDKLYPCGASDRMNVYEII